MMGILKFTAVFLLLCLIYVFIAPYAGLFFGQYFQFMKFGTNGMSEDMPALIPGFFLLNVIVIHLLFRSRFIWTMLYACFMACLGALSIYLVMEYKLAPVRDAYSIRTSVLTNAGVQLSCLGLIALFKRYKTPAAVKSSIRA